MACKRIKYRKYPFSLTVRMTVSNLTKVNCLDGTMKAHVRRNKKKVVLNFFFETQEKMVSLYNKFSEHLKR